MLSGVSQLIISSHLFQWQVKCTNDACEEAGEAQYLAISRVWYVGTSDSNLQVPGILNVSLFLALFHKVQIISIE
ncbi:hypothetical protein OUZ56_011778 [Daphnia magna]|uniref:Uncharacterized protein n=1 Tax=Daphnia magna TaxID=35525 RepID=A0ABQ9Z135_9CRUS|nr:hypothetical protein OUZ56_011778 [Daphnia magna]